MSPLRPRALALRARASLALLVLAGACSPTLPTPGGEGGGSAALTLVLEPAGELQAAPSVLRLRVTGAPIASLDASDVHLAQGSLTAQNLEDLALGLPSELDATERKRFRAVLLEDLLAQRLADGSFQDLPGLGRAYGTAAALLALDALAER